MWAITTELRDSLESPLNDKGLDQTGPLNLSVFLLLDWRDLGRDLPTTDAFTGDA